MELNPQVLHIILSGCFPPTKWILKFVLKNIVIKYQQYYAASTLGQGIQGNITLGPVTVNQLGKLFDSFVILVIDCSNTLRHLQGNAK